MAQHWYCRSCSAAASTVDSKIPHHRCPGQPIGLPTPLVRVGAPSKLEIVERGDWVGREDVQLDVCGRPVMAAVTTYDEHQDCTIYAPAARAVRD